MMFIYKNLLAETQDMNAAKTATDAQMKTNTSGMIDYEAFKKAIIRISAMAQEKLGGANDDVLKAKLNKDKKLLDEEDLNKKALKDQVKSRDNRDKKKQEKLKE